MKLRSAHKPNTTTYGIRAHVSTVLKVFTAGLWEQQTILQIARLVTIVHQHRKIQSFVQQELTTQRQTHGLKFTALTVPQVFTVHQKG